jgi:hypothetical protein
MDCDPKQSPFDVLKLGRQNSFRNERGDTLAQFITGTGGTTATIGGTVRVFGSSDVDVITLADVAGKITFDGSFNRGGDFIVLPNTAKTYSIARSGSSITLSDADSTITIPVGTKGVTLQFADGEALLKYDGQVLLGSQVISTTGSSITASLATKTALATAPGAIGTLIMVPNEPVQIGGDIKIFGTNDADTVTIADVAGSIVFDSSFNRGGDKVVLGKFAEDYTAFKPNASNVTIRDGDTKLTIPLGTKGLDIAFSNEDRTLVYASGNANLGNQVLTTTATEVLNFEENLKFSYQANSFKGNIPYPQVNSDWPILIDINHDGYMDMIFHYKNMQWRDTSIKLTENTEIPNNIAFLINIGGEYFEDQTDKYLIGKSNAGGNFTSPVIADINHDGYLDILFGTNQEDGARTEEANFGYLGALISDSGKYRIINFGDPLHYLDTYLASFGGHDYLLFNASGATSSNLNGSIPWEYDNITEKFIRSDIKFPEIIGNAYQFLNISGKEYVVRHNPTLGGFGLDGWVFDNGQWVEAGNIFNPFPFYKHADFTTWNGVESSVDTYKWGQSYIVGFGSGASLLSAGKLKIYPNSQEIALIKVDTWEILNGDFSQTSKITETKNVGILMAATFKNGSINLINLNIDNEDFYSNYQATAVSVLDYNKDGYDDIIVSKYSNYGYPSDIYLNNRNGGFHKVEYNIDLKLDPLADQEASLFYDFNKDGSIDFVLFPANSNIVESNTPPFAMNEFLYFTSSTSIIG